MRILSANWLAILGMVTMLSFSSAVAVPAYPTLPAPPQILETMNHAADWQLSRLDLSGGPAIAEKADPHGWSRATFWLGLAALADAGNEGRYRDMILALGDREQWRLGQRLHHPDDHLIGQVWLWSAEHGADAKIVPRLRHHLDAVLAYQPPSAHAGAWNECGASWCWCDALFMSPATFFGLSRITGDGRYADYADREFRATTELLYDPREKLFYRDSRFIGQRDSNGRKLFWSRGNGWVLAGLAHSMVRMEPRDSRVHRYYRLFRAMAKRAAGLQRSDGYWPSSLLGTRQQQPETSGTALFIFALAWGVNAGVLDRNFYDPVIARGWAALTRAVRADGRLGWVQPIGDRPGEASEDDTQPFGVGALLLAGSEVVRWARAGRIDDPRLR